MISGEDEYSALPFDGMSVHLILIHLLVFCETMRCPLSHTLPLPAFRSLPGPREAIASVEHFFADPTSTLEGVVQNVEEMGPSGLFYFGLVYTVAEILAIPAIPLTASAGYLFGTVQGTSVVLVSASIAAAVSFVIGRTLLRSYVL